MDTAQILKIDLPFRYQMLGRLQQDCEYYLGAGNRHSKDLWAGNVKDQIKLMKQIYDSFGESEKPEWITMDKIYMYEKCMLDTNVSFKMAETSCESLKIKRMK